VSELLDALERARRELAETKEALEAARGSKQRELAEQLASIQQEALALEKKGDDLEAEVTELRGECDRRLEALKA
jgi:predicted  nucleic acid-binding Zn-ribbon protein